MPPIGPTTSTPPSKPAPRTTDSTQPRLPLWKRLASSVRHQGTFNTGHNPTLPKQPASPHLATGVSNPLWEGLAPQDSSTPRDEYIDVTHHEPNSNGYLDIGPSATTSPSAPPPPPSNPMSKYGMLTFGIFFGSSLENVLRQPAGYVATQYVMESKSFPDIFATIRQNPGKLYGSFSAFKFNTFARFFQRGGCFEINHSLNGHLKDLSPTQKALITTGIVTAYEYLVNTPVDRAMTLYQADKVKHPGEAFKMNNLGELWRTLKSPATWEAGGAVLVRNLTFNAVMVVAMQNESESVKSTPMHYGYLATTSLTCALASQPFEVLRFERTKEEKPTSYFKKFTNLLREGGVSRLWKGSIPRVTSVGGGLMVSLTVYSEVKKVIANMENGNSQA